MIEEFAKGDRFISLTGMPPHEHTTKLSELEEFSRQLSLATGQPNVNYDNWGTALYFLAQATSQGRVIILLDEISWMGSKDPDFLGHIKTAWDTLLKKNDKLLLILCGSASSWIEKNILSSTGFLGRVSFTLTLTELPLADCVQFWGNQGANIDVVEKLKLLSVLGGIPRYLEEMDPKCSAEKNIHQMCFSKGGTLVDEFNRIFNDLFLSESDRYKKIVLTLANGAKEATEICSLLNIKQSGRISGYLQELCMIGFIHRDYVWDLTTKQRYKKKFRYRLSDNYLRFYLKYIEKHALEIDNGTFQFKSLTNLPGWEAVMGLQFENLVLNNRELIWKNLGLQSDEVLVDNPYFQRKTQKMPGCQIDYLIQSKFQTLYVCEIKFRKDKLGMEIIDSVQEKINRLYRTKGFSCRPVLIHVGGVKESLIESDYFTKIIDFRDYLET